NSVIVNKIVNEHNHLLNPRRIEFEDNKKFNDEMLEDVRFMTLFCKFGATSQRKFLEGKYSTQPIYSNDLYAAIQKFRPNSKSLLNDAVQ
ncbi:17330_t:CDS:1, partial [Racocetra fulgida]